MESVEAKMAQIRAFLKKELQAIKKAGEGSSCALTKDANGKTVLTRTGAQESPWQELEHSYRDSLVKPASSREMSYKSSSLDRNGNPIYIFCGLSPSTHAAIFKAMRKLPISDQEMFALMGTAFGEARSMHRDSKNTPNMKDENLPKTRGYMVAVMKVIENRQRSTPNASAADIAWQRKQFSPWNPSSPSLPKMILGPGYFTEEKISYRRVARSWLDFSSQGNNSGSRINFGALGDREVTHIDFGELADRAATHYDDAASLRNASWKTEGLAIPKVLIKLPPPPPNGANVVIGTGMDPDGLKFKKNVKWVYADAWGGAK